MTREEFYHAVQDNIRAMLPSDFSAYEVNLREMNASYGDYMGLTVGMFGNSIEPVFNLDHMYGLVSERPMSEALQRTADMITEHYRNTPEHMELIRDRCVDILSSFENAKTYMFAAACPMYNTKFLETAPYRMVDDIALLAKVDMTPDNSHSSMTVTIKNDEMERWGVSADEIMDQAIKNTKNLRPGKLQNLAEVLSGSFSKDRDLLLPPMDTVPPLYVYTNNKGIDGFAGLFSDGVMKEIYKQVKDDYYIMPSSIHEALIYPENGQRSYQDAKTFSDMVSEVNRTNVLDEDVVSDYAYHYDHETDRFEKAYDFVKRVVKDQNVEQDILPANIAMTMQVGTMEKQLI